MKPPPSLHTLEHFVVIPPKVAVHIGYPPNNSGKTFKKMEKKEFIVFFKENFYQYYRDK